MTIIFKLQMALASVKLEIIKKIEGPDLNERLFFNFQNLLPFKKLWI